MNTVDKETIPLEPCPFCGMRLDLLNYDVIYPSGIYWRKSQNGIHYVNHKNYNPETDNKCYVLVCPENDGGCDASMSGDSYNEVISKWNNREHKVR